MPPWPGREQLNPGGGGGRSSRPGSPPPGQPLRESAARAGELGGCGRGSAGVAIARRPHWTLSGTELRQFVIALARGPDVWTPHVNHADDARVFELIWNDADVHAWVICWSEDRAPDFTTLTSPRRRSQSSRGRRARSVCDPRPSLEPSSRVRGSTYGRQRSTASGMQARSLPSRSTRTHRRLAQRRLLRRRQESFCVSCSRSRKSCAPSSARTTSTGRSGIAARLPAFPAQSRSG
jgi:hypothetical protein